MTTHATSSRKANSVMKDHSDVVLSMVGLFRAVIPNLEGEKPASQRFAEMFEALATSRNAEMVRRFVKQCEIAIGHSIPPEAQQAIDSLPDDTLVHVGLLAVAGATE